MEEVITTLSDRLTDRQLRAASWFLRQLQDGHGTSGGLVSSMLEKVDGSPHNRSHPSGWTFAHLECQRVLDELRDHERATLRWLITRREPGQPATLAAYGRSRYGYDHANSASAAAVTAVIGLLDTIAEVAGVSETRRAA